MTKETLVDFSKELSPRIKIFILMMLAFSLSLINAALGLSACISMIFMIIMMLFFFVYYLNIYNTLPFYMKVLMPIPICLGIFGFVNGFFVKCL